MQVVVTHKSTDFDAIASMIAASLIYPGVKCVLPKILNPNVKAFLSIHKDIFSFYPLDTNEYQSIERLIVVDTNSWMRIDEMGNIRKNDIEVILWDHHEPADIQPNWKCQQDMGANITLLMREIISRDIQVSPIFATLFLLGLYEDTGNLTFPSVKADDAYTAGYLLDQKADLQILSTFLRPMYGELQKNILFEMLKTTRRQKIKGFSIDINKQEIKGHINGLALVVSMYREILNLDAAFGIFIDKERDRCIVIARSNHEDLNMGNLMRSMRGGGHPGAGSAMLKSISADAVEEMIIELIKGNQQSSIQVTDIMSYPVHTVSPDMSMEKLLNFLKEKKCTGVPVIQDGKIVGVISKRDFNKVRKSSQMKSPVKAFMNTQPITIASDRSPMEAAKMMIKYDIGRLPVIENDQMVGIVSRTDAMLYFYDLLPD
ncbi:MAG: CBS domain-containing protein [Desulfobacterales bacterium]|nr:CBS domain-containing protein [Desulfobacterales bacterium]